MQKLLKRRRSRGQALVEFSLVLPVFLVVVLGIFDFGRVIWAQSNLDNAAREGARYAIVHGDASGQTCPVGPAEGKWVDLTTVPISPATWTSCPYPSCPTVDRSGSTCSNYPTALSPSYNLRQSIYDATTQFVIAGGSNVTVTACYGSGCSGNTDVTPTTTVRSTAVTVSVSSAMSLIVPSLIGIHTFTIVGTSTMLVNN
jgi:TadE-like protein